MRFTREIFTATADDPINRPLSSYELLLDACMDQIPFVHTREIALALFSLSISAHPNQIADYFLRYIHYSLIPIITQSNVAFDSYR